MAYFPGKKKFDKIRYVILSMFELFGWFFVEFNNNIINSPFI
jgi:hypothetical protein